LLLGPHLARTTNAGSVFRFALRAFGAGASITLLMLTLLSADFQDV
jgi:hypothetical protein